MFEKLETFLILAACGSFTETARQLFCSQPTISNHIQQLEEMLGTKLFERSGKSVELTLQGKIFYEYAQKITRLFDEAAAAIKQAAPPKTILSVYASNYMGVYVVPEWLRQYHESYPAQQFELHTYGYDALHQLLKQDKIHSAFMPLYENDPYIQSEFYRTVLFEDQFLLVFPSGHPWTDRKLLYTRDLNHTTLLLPQSRLLQSCIVSPLQSARIQLTTVAMSNFEVIKEAVKSGLGIAFLPYYAVREQISKGELRTIPVCGLHISRKNGFIHRKSSCLTPAEQAFFSCIQHGADPDNGRIELANP
ncbi:LysR family transcriptional regulator [Paenibacillus rigui]|nr:LysR family transcriptional regulator [Paenibacillus rigui]